MRLQTGAASALWRSGSGWRAGAPARPPEVEVLTEDGRILSTALPRPRPAVVARSGGWAAVAPGRALAPGSDVAIDTEGWVWVHADGLTSRLQALDRREAMERRLEARDVTSAAAHPELRAPMPGAVVAVHVADGARVQAGERIVTIEAMKMEHPVIAPHDGIATITVGPGEQVRRDQVLARVTTDPEETGTPHAELRPDRR